MVKVTLFMPAFYKPIPSQSSLTAPALLATVRLCQVDNRSERHDPGGINFLVRHVVVPLDVIDADGLGDSRLLIEVQQVTVQIRVIDNAPKIAFEVAVIHDVEAN